MPFSSSAALTSTDMNNTLRGYFRDNSDHSVTGTVAETDLVSKVITGGDIGATGCIHILAAGTITGAAGNKTVSVYFGATQIATTGAVTGTGDWFYDVWIFNTASNAQRFRMLRGEISGAGSQSHDYGTAAIDTSANVTTKITGQLTSAADTITCSMFDIFICQIT